ncbi:MAG: hypothetical protein KGH54_03390 [Candidatus Micrarchaeota archaeon]|nr:hypothetical protein [Candidatus Micrarchaeota archaeon]
MRKVVDRENNLEGLTTVEKVKELLRTKTTNEIAKILGLSNGGLSKFTDVIHAEAIRNGKERDAAPADVDAFKLVRDRFKDRQGD